jgi:hypothetical protein
MNFKGGKIMGVEIDGQGVIAIKDGIIQNLQAVLASGKGSAKFQLEPTLRTVIPCLVDNKGRIQIATVGSWINGLFQIRIEQFDSQIGAGSKTLYTVPNGKVLNITDVALTSVTAVSCRIENQTTGFVLNQINTIGVLESKIDYITAYQANGGEIIQITVPAGGGNASGYFIGWLEDVV